MIATVTAWTGLAPAPIWPKGGPAPKDDVVGAAVAAFLAAELAPLGVQPAGGARATAGGPAPTVAIGAIGTTARHAVGSPMLASAVTAAGLSLGAARPFADPDALVADPDWTLGVVLSPWKRDVAARLGQLSASAAATGVVDTVLRPPAGSSTGAAARTAPIGLNTNSWAAQAVLELLAAGRTPASVVLLGAGASARSVALAVRRVWPAAPLLVSARSATAAGELAALAGAEAAAPADLPDALGGQLPTIVINSTAWGETADSEAHPFPFPTEALLGPGSGFFDLNNRLSDLQARALAAGCTVNSGTLMQRATHAARAAAVRAILTQETP
ncbi:hypothetical protein I6A84_12110 [Frankia sp. CNm7]|uniref:Shikimate dehydrogenase n=1 Tax=Frankia nepalensis TaxID=1836974 RepID=A0A937RL65_9ACTN|nr:hypothetical protein [Frankia nepalensis]MBL7498047.1 hypothetical protein [Frankia nepalensis]MBL7513564.1 hypothetical protein [Frankia nepalensis]MBL7518835.1 hypothetical protein [Frankia nepalensis]MBL7629349.1 hypothetical protein [Frankia nepalensis]